MKLIPQAEPLDYKLMWKCHACSKWNREDKESCVKCAQPQPIQARDAKPRQHLIRMLDTVIAYATDSGMNSCAPTILRAVILAYLTETEGYLESMCRAFGMLHNFYRRDGDRILTMRGQWKAVK